MKIWFESDFENINYNGIFMILPTIGFIYSNSSFLLIIGISLGWGYWRRSFELVKKK